MLRTKHGIRTKFLNKCKIWIATAFIIADASPMLSSFYFDSINLCLVNTFSHLYVTSRFSVFDLFLRYFLKLNIFLFQTKICRRLAEFFSKQSFDCYRNFRLTSRAKIDKIKLDFRKSSFLRESNFLFESWNGKIRFPWKSVEIKMKGSLIRWAMILNYELQTIFLSRFHSNTSSWHELALTFHLADSAPQR